jgi:hypothetical protein
MQRRHKRGISDVLDKTISGRSPHLTLNQRVGVAKRIGRIVWGIGDRTVFLDSLDLFCCAVYSMERSLLSRCKELFSRQRHVWEGGEDDAIGFSKGLHIVFPINE